MTTDSGGKHLSLRQRVRTLDSLCDAQAATIRELEEKVGRLAEESLVFQGAHAQEKKAREGWVQAYRDTITRAEKAEQALDAAMSVVRENAEGMADCVTAGPQCHYELPYEACKRLLAVLKSDALQHVHVYAPDTRVCSCGHAEADDSR